jgi:EmrB/QacA subfamily drug resistance transporter
MSQSNVEVVREPWSNEQKQVLLVTSLGSFMTTLGTGLVSVAAPEIQASFGVSLGEASWTVTAYLLSVSVLLVIFGRLGDVLGYRRLLGYGIVGFAVASILCAMAPTYPVLLGGRLLQGASAAILMAMGPALITTSIPGQVRGRALGVLGTMTYLGLSTGPILGGAMIARLSWRAAFIALVPIAGVCFWSLRRLGSDTGQPATVRRAVDATSAMLWAGFLGSTLITLGAGETEGWASRRIQLLIATGLVAFGVFVWRQRRINNPLVSWKLFENPVFGGSTIAALLLYLVSFLMMFVMPFFLKNSWHLPLHIVGLILTIQPVVMAFVAPLSGSLADRVGPRVPAAIGMVIIAVALFTCAGAAELHSLGTLVACLALFGAGAGLFTTANNSAIMGSAPREQQGAASAILGIARNVGMAAGVALGGALYAGFGGNAAPNALAKTLLCGAVLAIAGAIFGWARQGEQRAYSGST